jgi:hypothetical protein
VQRHRDAAAGRGGNDDPGGLRNAHDSADVHLGENPFDGDDVRLVQVKPLIDGVGYDQQALIKRQFRGRTHHSDGDHGGPPVPLDVYYTDAATGKARIDSQYAKSQVRAFLFVIKIGCCHAYSASRAACTSSLKSALL